MSEPLSGPEKLMQMMMKSMGINPTDLIAKFQEPIEKGLAGIKDVDSRLAKLENDVSRILSILQRMEDDERPREPLRLVEHKPGAIFSSDDSPFIDTAARIAG